MDIATTSPVRTVAPPTTPKEELPDWVMSSVLRFLQPFFAGHGPAAEGFGPGFGYTEAASRDFLMEIERTCRIGVPWGHGRNAAAEGVWRVMYEDRALAVRVLDYALGDVMLGYEAQGIMPAIGELNRALQQAGTNYRVVQPEENRIVFRLERRISEPAAATFSSATTITSNASDHLKKAREAAFGREPDPSTAYWESVKAVEAAAIPVVTPNNKSATLGTILGELRANPQKFSVIFTRGASPAKGAMVSPLEVVIALGDLLWKNHTNKHGTPEQSVPITPKQAEMAVPIAVTLVELFRSAVTSP